MPKDTSIQSILVIGSGPIIIGQAAEFDYAGTQACIALKEEGYRIVLLNNNPATVMTDQSFADAVYFEPMTVESAEKIIMQEKPDGLLATFGGQAGLNLAFQLSESGILEKFGIKVLGTSISSIKNGEDRDLFRSLMHKLGEPVPDSTIVHSIKEALDFAHQTGFPVIVRPAYTLGGSGGGIAATQEELATLVGGGLNASPIGQCLIEKSIAGYKEIEYEMMRDESGTCIAVCNMENFDPVGIHTGDSIVVAPSQTLTDKEYHMLRSASVRIISALGIVGGCNIQFALDPKSKNYFLIEVNPRVSRSSALASKATGYPIARMAAKLAVGYMLSELKNPVTGNTFASYEPALDYVVVKIPKWPFDKFPAIQRTLGTQMKATGEAMGIDRSFERALLKAVRSLELKVNDLSLPHLGSLGADALKSLLLSQTDERLFVIMELLRRGEDVSLIHELTHIDLFFLTRLKRMALLEKEIVSGSFASITKNLLLHYKEKGFSDRFLASAWKVPEEEVRKKRDEFGLQPVFKMVDTCAAEFASGSNYFYSSYHGVNEAIKSGKRKILIIGSGPIRIGQGIEFDYCSVHGVLALKEEGIETVMINNNPETVSTDFAISDRLYFEPIVLEDILAVIENEGIQEVIVQLGGQTALDLSNELEKQGITILGVNSATINVFEDREEFYSLLDRLEIPRVKGEYAWNEAGLIESACRIGYPLLVRPSYVIGGQDMKVILSDEDLQCYIADSKSGYPLLVDQFLQAKEAEIDLAADGEHILVPAFVEHIETTGVHSGDSFSVIPAQSLSGNIQQKMFEYASRIVKATQYKGLMNIQYIVNGNTLLILEVNPRSSRTMPIVSKVTGIPLVNIATKILLGKYKLSKDISPSIKFTENQDYVCIKHPVFSNFTLPGLDMKTGPEMMSTGEAISIAGTLQEALKKSFLAQTGKKIAGSILYPQNENVSSLVQQSSDTGVRLVSFSREFLDQEEVAGVLCTGQTREDLILREWAIKNRKLIFSRKETFIAYLKANTIEDWNVRPMGKWLEQKNKGVIVN
ncbi:carbamoyl phosphate synthase large subunit [Mesobacillus zeae]|uniref:Carbamoyl phosphate synthase large subunit n=1 Tax=Mesobacillus zeae TaxID=1917180 RepID=A0A398B6V4_9BACI|nr:carbamoyl phosphate synthase large subunit [Mesobacillus zeae]RID84548.1 carbamoyl phosphate synthase large subunit [Mesobacillus zeae]